MCKRRGLTLQAGFLTPFGNCNSFPASGKSWANLNTSQKYALSFIRKSTLHWISPWLARMMEVPRLIIYGLRKTRVSLDTGITGLQRLRWCEYHVWKVHFYRYTINRRKTATTLFCTCHCCVLRKLSNVLRDINRCVHVNK